MKLVATIGLEVHVQLNTVSKLFCSCSTKYGAEPNAHVCPVCLGYPGTLPVVNREAVKKTVLTGLMIGSRISEYSKFDRKSYFYPDMPKNYQISQYDKPLCNGGIVEITVAGIKKNIRITRIHLEEDVGKSMHFVNCSGVDFNRAGVPLMEIVSEPELHTPEEAFAYLQSLKQILQYAGVSDCNPEEGNIRCDVNCSVSPEGSDVLGTKSEIKNLNTFKGVLNSLKYEIARQIELVESGQKVTQETRRWDADKGETFPMRSKEYAHDYRYFPEPDLMPMILNKQMIETWRAALPEVPQVRKQRFVSQYNIPEYDAGVLVADKYIADYYEAASKKSQNPKGISNLMMTEMLRLLAENEMDIRNVKITPQALAELVDLVDGKVVNSNTAREIIAELFKSGGMPGDIVKARGLAQVSDESVISGLVDKVIAENPKSVEDYKNGKKAALKFLVGQVMKLSKGKADPLLTAKLLEGRF